MAKLRFEAGLPVRGLAPAGNPVRRAVLLDRPGLATEDFLAGIVPAGACRVVPMDDSVSDRGVAGRTVPVRPRAAFLGSPAALAGVRPCGAGLSGNLGAAHATF